MFRILPHQVRIPDVAFVSWAKLPQRKLPKKRIPDLYPNLAVEALSEGNTPAEMKRKLAEYFQAGVEAVWLVDLEKRTVTAFSSPAKKRVFHAGDVLTGGKVLPGFTLPLEEYFERVGEKEA